MKQWKAAVAVVVLSAFLAGCGGMFSSPYDIAKPAPGADKTPADLVPADAGGAKVTDQKTTELSGTFTGAAVTATYDNGVELTIAKLADSSQALKRLEQFYNSEIKGGTKSKLGAGTSAWSKGSGSNYWGFAWTNNNWIFIVHAKSQADAEKVILGTGMASKAAAK
jgi:hypothetical protein